LHFVLNVGYLLDYAKFFGIEFHGYLQDCLCLAKNDFAYATPNQRQLQRGQFLHFRLLAVTRYLLDCAKFFGIEFHDLSP
jgi:hypothetical protein